MNLVTCRRPSLRDSQRLRAVSPSPAPARAPCPGRGRHDLFEAGARGHARAGSASSTCRPTCSSSPWPPPVEWGRRGRGGATTWPSRSCSSIVRRSGRRPLDGWGRLLLDLHGRCDPDRTTVACGAQPRTLAGEGRPPRSSASGWRASSQSPRPRWRAPSSACCGRSTTSSPGAWSSSARRRSRPASWRPSGESGSRATPHRLGPRRPRAAGRRDGARGGGPRRRSWSVHGVGAGAGPLPGLLLDGQPWTVAPFREGAAWRCEGCLPTAVSSRRAGAARRTIGRALPLRTPVLVAVEPALEPLVVRPGRAPGLAERRGQAEVVPLRGALGSAPRSVPCQRQRSGRAAGAERGRSVVGGARTPRRHGPRPARGQRAATQVGTLRRPSARGPCAACASGRNSWSRPTGTPREPRVPTADGARPGVAACRADAGPEARAGSTLPVGSARAPPRGSCARRALRAAAASARARLPQVTRPRSPRSRRGAGVSELLPSSRPGPLGPRRLAASLGLVLIRPRAAAPPRSHALTPWFSSFLLLVLLPLTLVVLRREDVGT